LFTEQESLFVYSTGEHRTAQCQVETVALQNIAAPQYIWISANNIWRINCSSVVILF